MAGVAKRRASNYCKVALMIETSRGFGRQLLAGIARYSHLHGPWSFFITPGDFEQVVPRMKEWGGHGIIARVANQSIEDAVVAANVPTIVIGLRDRNLRKNSPLLKASEIRGNSMEAAKLVADHLLQKHFKNYAYVGSSETGYSKEREIGFCARIGEAGFEPIVYSLPKKKAGRNWELEYPKLVKWIERLPKPIGIMACNDDRGREVLDACQLANAAVPENISVVGVDNDELLCDLADPPLSSVEFNAELGGFQAAQLLDSMMSRRVRKPQVVTIEPIRVVSRRSSDIIAMEDPEVANALAFIHQSYGRDITVDDVADHLAVSRRYLEVRFREETGRTILGEITRVRIDSAKRLLEMTDYSIPKVARLAGYNSASYLITVFKKHLKTTPAQYRANLRA